MQKPKLDPRAQRSREWMKNALLELIDEKDYEEITVSEITARAGLSRPTFYLHYKTKEEILLDYLDTIFDRILEEFHEFRQDSEVDEPGFLAMTKMFDEILKHINVFQVMLLAGVERLFLQHTYHRNLDYLEDLARRCEMNIATEVLELSAQFLAGALVGVIISWVQSEIPHSPEQMGRYYTEMIRPILRTVVCNGELDYIFAS